MVSRPLETLLFGHCKGNPPKLIQLATCFRSSELLRCILYGDLVISTLKVESTKDTMLCCFIDQCPFLVADTHQGKWNDSLFECNGQPCPLLLFRLFFTVTFARHRDFEGWIIPSFIRRWILREIKHSSSSELCLDFIVIGLHSNKCTKIWGGGNVGRHQSAKRNKGPATTEGYFKFLVWPQKNMTR